jgi:hypothetical protein
MAATLAAAVLTPALADGNLQPRLALPIYKQECAACHLAYPPGLLPARSWSRIMSGLDKHCTASWTRRCGRTRVSKAPPIARPATQAQTKATLAMTA